MALHESHGVDCLRPVWRSYSCCTFHLHVCCRPYDSGLQVFDICNLPHQKTHTRVFELFKRSWHPIYKNVLLCKRSAVWPLLSGARTAIFASRLLTGKTLHSEDHCWSLTIYEAQGHCFRLATPSNNHLMVTSEKHIQELANAPFQQLSLHAVAKEVQLLMFG